MARMVNAFSGVRAPSAHTDVSTRPCLLVCGVGRADNSTGRNETPKNKNIMMQAPGSTFKNIWLFYAWASRQ